MYDEFYQLSGRPFQLTPDPDFYFESASHRKALSYLGYGLAQGEGFIVITGEVGAGKSTLAAHLLATIDRNRLTAGQIVTSKLDGEELVHVSAHAFGLDVQGHDKASALSAIEQFLHEEARAGRRCLLVVDEAQNLSVDALEELRMLSNFQLGAHPLLQILLLGQPEFRTLLQGSQELEQLRQRVIASHHLEAMEPGEVSQYVEHRLARVGWTGENPGIDQRVYADLARASAGIPRRINQIVSRLLLLGAVEQRTRLDGVMLKTVLDDLARDTVAPEPVVTMQPAAVEVPPLSPPAPAEPEQPVAAADRAPAQTVAADATLIEQIAGLQEAIARRDEQIAELQQAVIELAEMRPAEVAFPERPNDAEMLETLSEAARRISALEARALEQEQTMRHTLTMLIEWIEADDPHRAAA
jgi:putative secretion ATPase (PEP-CTERM system associated)